MSTTWPVRDRLTMAACPMIRPCLQCVLPGRRDESQRVVADDSHERGRERLHLSCLPAARSRSPQQQAEHVHLLVATRLVAEQFEQQRAAENRNAERSRAPTSRSDAPSRRSVTFTQRSTRAAAGVGPTTSRNAPPLLPLSATQHTVVLTYLLTVFRTPPQTTHANVGDLHTQL